MNSEYLISIDLGTTNTKFSLFDQDFKTVISISNRINYIKKNNFVEFDAEKYWLNFKKGLKELLQQSEVNPKKVVSISLTGQAESFILLDLHGEVIRNGISWLDNRSSKEVAKINTFLSHKECYKITGQPSLVTTFPLSKLLWINDNEAGGLKRVGKILMLKDFITYKISNEAIGDISVYNFSYYFDIVKKRYWQEALDIIDVKKEQLPVLEEPGTEIKIKNHDFLIDFGFSKELYLNIGILDHFAGMIGSGSLGKKTFNETTGTVMTLAALTKNPHFNAYSIPCHYFMNNKYCLLSCCESGGISFDWFKEQFYPDNTFSEINNFIEKSSAKKSAVFFLPYIVGVNSPEYDPFFKGCFYGIDISSTRTDFARSVLEGVAFLLRKNIEAFEKIGYEYNTIISQGGGASSSLWNQIKANVTAKKIVIPRDPETSSLGAAIIAAISRGWIGSIESAEKDYIKMGESFTPQERGIYDEAYEKFNEIYMALKPVYNRDE